MPTATSTISYLPLTFSASDSSPPPHCVQMSACEILGQRRLKNDAALQATQFLSAANCLQKNLHKMFVHLNEFIQGKSPGIILLCTLNVHCRAAFADIFFSPIKPRQKLFLPLNENLMFRNYLWKWDLLLFK